jgi:hypothetical protein
MGKGGGSFSTRRRGMQDIVSRNIKPLVLIQVKIHNCIKGDKCLKGYRILSFHFCHFTRFSRTCLSKV